MSDEKADNPKTTPSAAQRAMVRQSHGGAIKPGGNPRIVDPTPADVAALARKRVYQVIPKLARIANNRPRKGAKKGAYSISSQLKAIDELRLLAQDRSLAEAQVAANLLETANEINEFLPRDQAQALMQKIAPHWLKA